MRIDYSEPKKSCSSPQSSQSRPRKESTGFGLITLLFFGLICLGLGFGSGWTLSQRAAKKGFKAAMEQQSLENSPQQVKALPTPHQSTLQAPGSPQQPPVAGSSPQPGVTGGAQPANDPPLSFYKTLPSGQKSNVLGSGINSKEEKAVKQPLQAAMPTNMTKPAAPQDADITQKQPAAQNAPARPGTRPDSSGFTVQVASYSLKSEAETLRSTLAAKGYNVGIIESHLGEKGTWYRVRVGKRLDPDAAKDLAKKLGKGAIAIPDKD